jgi:hypothetical protein
METQLEGTPEKPAWLSLPEVQPNATNLLTIPFLKPAVDPELPGYYGLNAETLSGFAEVDGVTRDTLLHTTSVTATNSGKDHYPWGEMAYTEWIKHTTHNDNPALTQVESIYTTTVTLPRRILTWKGILDFSSDLENYYYRYRRTLEENNRTIREKEWVETIKRQ